LEDTQLSTLRQLVMDKLNDAEKQNALNSKLIQDLKAN
jgi:hypothetical protein